MNMMHLRVLAVAATFFARAAHATPCDLTPTALVPQGGWQLFGGKFSGAFGPDTRLVGYHPTTGNLYAFTRTGDTLVPTLWNTVGPPDGWVFTSVELTGDGATDLVGIHPSDRSLWLLTWTPAGFTYRRLGFVPAPPTSSAGEWKLVSLGSEVLVVAPGETQFHLARLINGALSLLPQSMTGLAAGTHQFSHADVSQSSPGVELVAYDATSGDFVVGTRTSGGFSFSPRTVRPFPATGYRMLAGNFDQTRAGDEFLFFYPPNGTLWLANGDDSFDDAGQVASSATLIRAPGSTPELLFAYDSSTGHILEAAPGRRTTAPQAYVWPLEVTAGQGVHVFASSGDSRVDWSLDRYTSIGASVTAVRVAGGTWWPPDPGPTTIPSMGWRNGFDWPERFGFTAGNWKSGIYSLRLDGHCSARPSSFAPVVVSPAPGAPRARIAVVANVNTWSAYDEGAGRSSYSLSAADVLSFKRPFSDASPHAHDKTHLLRGELWMLGWLDAEDRAHDDDPAYGVELSYDVWSDRDFHAGKVTRADYDLVVLTTHPEYWTTQAYDNLRQFLEAGGSLMYLGGNGIYQRVSYEGDGSQMRIRLSPGDAREWGLFRTTSRPESMLLGQSTERCGVPSSGYVVEGSDPLLGGLSAGTILGQTGLASHPGLPLMGASGLEIDGFGSAASRSVFPPGCTGSESLDPSSTYGELLQLSADVQAAQPHPFVNYRVLARRPGSSSGIVTFGYQRSDGLPGGQVFSVGSISFTGALFAPTSDGLALRDLLRRAFRDALAASPRP